MSVLLPERPAFSDAERNGYAHYSTWEAYYLLDCWIDSTSADNPEGDKSKWNQECHDLFKELHELEYNDEDSREWIQENICNSALSVEVRTGWYQVGEDDGGPDEFRIVFSTNGPHFEMRGKLDKYNEPCQVEVYVMQWGEPLHEIARGISSEVLNFVASLFHFES